jgi:hypothetical protein
MRSAQGCWQRSRTEKRKGTCKVGFDEGLGGELSRSWLNYL